MDVRCDKCNTEYEFDSGRIGPHGVTVKCTNCGYVFKVHRPDAGAPSRDWLVRTKDSQIIAFRQLTTLQKWIIEGRVERSDEISRNGETWKRLGNIGELEPFFSVYDKARALNDLMTTGSIGEQPVIVNGSEVLASMNPLSSQAAPSPLPPATPPPPPPDEAPSERPSLPPEPIATSARPAPRRASLSARPHPRAQARGPLLITRQHDEEPTESKARQAIPNQLVEVEEPKTPATQLTSAVDTPDERLTPRVSSETEDSSRPTDPPPPARPTPIASPLAVDLPGPAALRNAPTERLASVRSGSEIVRELESQLRTRRLVMSAVGLLLLGLGGGAAFALLGPDDDNPLRAAAEKWGFLAPRAAIDPVAAQLESAYREFDLDTPSSLERAENALAEVAKARPDEPRYDADRALLLMTRADALRRSARERDHTIAHYKAAVARWEKDARRARAIAKRKGEPYVAPEQPKTVDVASLEKSANEERAEASKLVKEAFELARQAHARAPGSLAASRALAQYYLVQRDDQGLWQKHLDAAKEQAAQSGTGDAHTKYIEASALLADVEQADPQALLHATQLLEEALTMRPTMVRARVLLARVLLARSMRDLARQEIDRVLSAVPDHPEARALRALLDSAPPAETPVAETPVAEAPTDKTSEPPAEASPPPEDEPGAKVKKVKVVDASEASSSRGYQDWMRLGDSLREKGDFKAALRAFEKAADRRLNAPQAYAGMGWAYLDMRKPMAALHVFQRAIRINDKFPDGHLGKAICYRQMSKRPEAIGAYKDYLALGPTGGEAIAAKNALAELERQEQAAQAAAQNEQNAPAPPP